VENRLAIFRGWHLDAIGNICGLRADGTYIDAGLFMGCANARITAYGVVAIAALVTLCAEGIFSRGKYPPSVLRNSRMESICCGVCWRYATPGWGVVVVAHALILAIAQFPHPS
jgi:hypothetical protein